MGASRGIGRAIAAALAREGCRVAIASRSREQIDEAAAAIDPPASPFVADASDLERLAGAPRRGRGGARPDRRPRRQHRRPAVRRRPRPRPRGLGTGLPLAGPGAEGARRRRRPRDARARLGPDRQRRLQLDPRADSRPQPLQRPPDGRDRIPEDAGDGGRAPTASPSTRSPPAASPPSASPTRADRSTAPKRPPGARFPPAASASPRSTATSSPSSAPSAPPTSPGP